MMPENAIDEHGEIVNYVMLVDTEHIDLQAPSKKQVWIYVMLKELSSI